MEDREKTKDQLVDELQKMRVRISELEASQGDVSLMESIKKELKESEELHLKLFQSMWEGFAYCRMIYDDKGQPEDFVYLDVNGAFQRLTGLSNVLGKRVSDVIPGIKKAHPEIFEIYGRVAKTGQPEKFEINFKSLDIILNISVFSPRLYYFVAIFENVTEIRTAEKEKIDLLERLFQSEKLQAIATLVGGIAHDFNNMLQIIMGYSQLLLEDKRKNDQDYEDLQDIVKIAEQGADLVRRLLIFAREAPTEKSLVDLNYQIRKLSNLISSAFPKMIEVDIDLSEGLHPILADPAQIDQVIMNLAINASESMKNGGRLQIETKNVFIDNQPDGFNIALNPGAYVKLSVSDTGIGMDKQTITRIFDPFFSTKERGSTRGTGLGLCVVDGIVQNHGGSVTCESEPGKGTVFSVYFPKMEYEESEELITQSPPVTLLTGTILMVEDEPLLCDFGKRVLSYAGHDVIVALNGRQALDIYRSRQKEISLVMLDLLMPEMGGRDCLKELAKINPSVKVIIATGLHLDDQLKEELAPFVKGIVYKPYRVFQLQREVNRALASS
jgi:two-component system, cell cycle sensor histidine kinase and response regulator CckA